MEYKTRDQEASQETEVGDFAVEREMTEAKHRAKVLNLKSFDSERKHMETRFRAELEHKKSDPEAEHGDEHETGGRQNELDTPKDKLKRENDGQRKRLDKEKGDFMDQIKKLEDEVAVRRYVHHESGDEKCNIFSPRSELGRKIAGQLEETDCRVSWTTEGPTQDLLEREASVSRLTRSDLRNDELDVKGHASKCAGSSQKSVNELEEENKKIQEELDCQHKKVGELQGQVYHLSCKLDTIQEVFEDRYVTAADIKKKIRGILDSCPSYFPDGNSEIRKKRSLNESANASTVSQQHRSNSEMSFRIEELNLENEELKSKINEMERKVCRTVDEFEIQRTVFKEKLLIIQQKLESQFQELEKQDQNSQVSWNARDILENTMNETKTVELANIPGELLEDYINIFLRQKSDSKSPDVFDVSLPNEIQSLEQLLDVEIFDGRVFDDVMKDEVKQVLRDKERELIVAYALENLRDEIRHRLTTESILEELSNEREKALNISEAATEVLKEHLGMSSREESTSKELENALMGYSQEEAKLLEGRANLGTSSPDVKALKAEKELEQELQGGYNKDAQDGLNQIQSPREDDSEQFDSEDMVNENPRSQKGILEQVLNTERFYLSRLYYMEMKEELEVSMKQYQFQRSGKLERERLAEAWRHHAEVGELYRKILDKENEDIERTKKLMQERERERHIHFDVSSKDILKEEILRLEIQLPMKLDLAELQKKRYREHEAATLILKQAVNAVETAVQEHDALLVSSDYLRRKSSWASSDEDHDNAGMPVWGFQGCRSSKPVYDGKNDEMGNRDGLCEDSIESKEALRKALISIFRKVINERTEAQDTEQDSCSSDSELNELESFNGKDIPSDDELQINDPESGDVLSDGSPQGSSSEVETVVGRKGEDDSQTKESTSPSLVPKVFTLSPEIENMLNIERINMSRVLRDEYVDKIRRGREKLRVVKAQNYENNEGLLAKFQERVGVLLERTDFGDLGEEGDEVSPKRPKLTSTPSDDSGIADFVDVDRDEVVRKYKKLLEKARVDLNHAHKALKDRSKTMDEDKLNDDFAKMKRNLKENVNDLQELQNKLSALESEREDLLDKIRGTINPTNVLDTNIETKISDEVYDRAPKEKQDFQTQSVTEFDADTYKKTSERKSVPGTGDGKETCLPSTAVNLPEERDNKKELGDKIPADKSFVANAGNEEIEADSKLLTKENKELKREVNELEKEIEIKDMKFPDENRRKQEEMEELQRTLMEGIGEENVIDDLQDKLTEAVEEKRNIREKYSEFEKRKEQVRCDDENKLKENLEKEVERFKTEVMILEKENELKQGKINELQAKLVEGSDGIEVVEDLQNEMKELYKKNKILQNKCNELEKGTVLKGKYHLFEENKTPTIDKLKAENEASTNENQEKTDEVEKLQNDFLERSGSDDIFKDIRNNMKNSRDTDKEKKSSRVEQNEGKCSDDETKDGRYWKEELSKFKHEKLKLTPDNKNKKDEIVEIQRKFLEGSRGAEPLESLQQQMKKLPEEIENSEVLSQDLEGVTRELKSEQEVDDAQLETATFKTREGNVREVEKNNLKEIEVHELRKNSIESGQGEAVVLKLLDKIKEVEGDNKTLEKLCRDLKDTCEMMEQKENCLANENREMAKEFARLRKENDYLELESQTKTAEITKLQERLLAGTGGEEILQELQNQVKKLECMNEDLRKQCNDVDSYKTTFKGSGDEVENETNKKLLKSKNDTLELDKMSKDAKKSNLRWRPQEGAVGDILENDPDQFKRIREDDESKRKEKTDKISGLSKEKPDLADENHFKDSVSCEVPEVLVGSSEEGGFVRKLNDKVRDLEENKKATERRCTDVESANEIMKDKVNDLTNENEETTTEVARVRKENYYLKYESQAKTDEIRKLQKLLDEAGGQEILRELQNQVKELEEMNKNLRKKCDEMEDGEETLKDDRIHGMKKDLVKLKIEKRNMSLTKKEKDEEVDELQKHAHKGIKEEEMLGNLRDQVKVLREENDELQMGCREWENVIRRLKDQQENREYEVDEISRFRKQNEDLVAQNKKKSHEIRDLQSMLVSGTRGEEIVRQLHDELKMSKQENDDLQKYCKGLENANKRLRNKSDEKSNEEIARPKNENGSLKKKGQAKDSEVDDTEVMLGKETGSQEMLPKFQDKVQELEDENENLQGTLYSSGNKKQILKETGIESGEKMERKLKGKNEQLSLDNNNELEEISQLQRELLERSAEEDVLQNRRDDTKQFRERKEKLKTDHGDFEDVHEKWIDEKVEWLGEMNKMSGLMEENVKLLAENDSQSNKIRELERKLVDRTGLEEVLPQLQEEIQNLMEKNKELEIQNEDLKNKNLRLGDEGDMKLKREMTKIMAINKELENEIQVKHKDINRMQKKLVEGIGIEEIVQELQDQVSKLEERNKELRKIQNGVENSEEMVKTDHQEEHFMNELDRREKAMDSLEDQNKKQKDEVVKVQKRLVGSIGDEGAIDQIQEQLKNSKEENNRLRAYCHDLEAAVNRWRNKEGEGLEKAESDPIKSRETERLKKHVEMLELENKSKEEEIFGLQKKLLERTGGEEILQQLQDRLKGSEEKNKNLEVECSNLDEARNDLRRENEELLKTRDTVGSTSGCRRNASGTIAVAKTGRDTSPTMMEKEGKGLLRGNGQQYTVLNGDATGTEEKFRVENILDGRNEDKGPGRCPETPLSDSECAEIFPNIVEERDHWEKKYKTLRRKVGEQFVDIIPEFLARDEKLEKQRVQTLCRLSDLQNEIGEIESPLLKTMAESKRVEMELREVNCQLEDNAEQLERIRNLRGQEERIDEEESRLKQCLVELESNSIDSGNLELSSRYKREDFDESNILVGGCADARKERINELYQELNDLQVNVTQETAENKRKGKDNITAMIDEKLKIQREIEKLDQAIEDLQQGSSAIPNISQPTRSASRDPEDARRPNYENPVTKDELEKVCDEISTLQSSLEASRTSSERDVENLVALTKEKSKLEDELSYADKALNQLGKREYENLLKERGKQKKVAKRLLELSREKEIVQSEFEEVESLVKAKEGELMSYFVSEREKNKLREVSFEKERVSKRRTTSIEKKVEAAEYAEGESAQDSAEEQKELTIEEVVNVSEELGSMIQKKSSLGVRVESLGKEITTQSLKVEKSLVDPSGEVAPRSSPSSLDELTQSQLSIFDDYNMIDELSLATRLVREERIKRKASKKAPMAKLLKERAGLEKKIKELEGKVLVQNAKIRNALREGKDASRAREKFTRAIEERGKIEDELESVINRIDECKRQSDEPASKGKLGKRRWSSGSLEKKEKSSKEKAGKSLSKNDKRRLFSQRESLEKQLDSLKRQIEDFSLDGDDGGLEDIPEAAEFGDVRKMVERLRELLIQEAELKQKLEGVRKNDEDSRDEKSSSEDSSFYPGVVDVLQTERKNKQAKLIELGKGIELEKRLNVAEKAETDLLKKRKAFIDKVESTLKELQLKKQSIRAGASLTSGNKTNLMKEQLLKDNVDRLTRQKEQVEKELSELQESLQNQTFSNGQNSEEITQEYRKFAKLKSEEEHCRKALESINEQFSKRKEWDKEICDVEQQQTVNKQSTDGKANSLSHSYAEILKKMNDENLNMADLIHELEVTRETLSKEREITGELLDLIKSRVGNELLEALTGDGPSSTSKESAVQDDTGSGKYREVADKVEHGSVTVAEIIANYKKVNALAQEENRKCFNMLGMLRSKTDKDLFASIISEEPDDLKASKKIEISKILENDETLFQQIVSREKIESENKSLLEHVRFLEEENEKLKIKQNKQFKEELERSNQEFGNISTEFDEVKKKRNKRNTEHLEEMKKNYSSSKEMLDNLEKENNVVIPKFPDSRNGNEEMKNETKYLKEEMDLQKDEMDQQIREMKSKFEEAEKMKSKIEDELKCVIETSDSLAVELAATEQEKNEKISELEHARKLNEEMKQDLERNQQLESEYKSMEKKLVAIEYEFSETVSNLEEANKINNGFKNKLNSEQDLREENQTLKEKLAAIKEENKDVVSQLEEAEKVINEMKNQEMKDENTVGVDNESNQGMNNESRFDEEINQDKELMKEKIDSLEKQNHEVICNLNHADRANKEMREELKDLGTLREENASMKQMLHTLETENNEIVPTLEKLKKAKKDLEDEVEYLCKERDDLESELEKLSKTGNGGQFREELEVLKNEKDEIRNYLEKVLHRNMSGGVKKALEDLRKEFKEMEEQHQLLTIEYESSRELKKIVGESLAEKLLNLCKGTKSFFDDTHYTPRCLVSIRTDGITLVRVLENYEKDFDMVEQLLGSELFGCILKRDLEPNEKVKRTLQMLSELEDDQGKDLMQIVKTYEDLIDSQANEINKVQGLSQKVITMEAELETLKAQKDQVEEELDDLRSQYNAKLVTAVNNGEEIQGSLKHLNEGESLKKSKHLRTEEKPEYIANDKDDDSHLEELKKFKNESKVYGGVKDKEKEFLEFDLNKKGMLIQHHGFEPLDMGKEYQELFKKVVERQREIEEAKEMLREQRDQHEMEKQRLMKDFNSEKNGMQYQIECERKSMEEAMQNLVNEIVRLKEERKEIRKANRLEKEKVEMAFEKERAELYSNNQSGINEIHEKLKKAFLETSQKEKVATEQREKELREEVVKLKSEKKDMAVKLKEMELCLERELSVYKESGHFRNFLKKQETREEIRNEFEEKLKQEKKNFQETLVSLRQEINRLQLERSRIFDEISRKSVDALNEGIPDYSDKFKIYEKIESDFKAKALSEKLTLENRIEDLRREKEELNKHKKEMKANMRKQRLEMYKKHEKEKEELAEKYRGELKALRIKLYEKVKAEVSVTARTSYI